MKICLIDPRGIHFGLNTGLGYIASYLKQKNGMDGIKVFDFNNNRKNMDARIEEIAGYDVIGFSLKSFTKDYALSIASRVKTRHNVLIAGGPHMALDGVNFLEQNRIFDFGVSGEGELSASALLAALNGSGSYDSISGLIRRKDNRAISNGGAERVTNLDSLPFPDYSVFDSVADGVIQNYPLVTSRGCPYLCTYCCVKVVMGRSWIPRTVDAVIDELKQAKQRYKIENFNVQDDNFSLDMKRAKLFCEALADQNLDLKWSCPNGIRADKVDDELMQKMRKAGCFAVALGIESGVKKEFETIKKGEKLADIVEAARLARKNRIAVLGNFIIGLPHSTLKSIRESIVFARKLRLEACIFNLFVPFPGTEVWEWVQNNGQMLMDWKDGFTQGRDPKIVFETDEFSKQDRLRAYYEANMKCKNYFAFMDEHVSLGQNVINVVANFLKYDMINITGHIFWILKHSRRILARITDKTHR